MKKTKLVTRISPKRAIELISELAPRNSDKAFRAAVFEIIAMTGLGERPGFDPEEEVKDAYRSLAMTHWHKEGEIEIDEDAEVSLGEDPGAYVQAWVWVEGAGL